MTVQLFALLTWESEVRMKRLIVEEQMAWYSRNTTNTVVVLQRRIAGGRFIDERDLSCLMSGFKKLELETAPFPGCFVNAK